MTEQRPSVELDAAVAVLRDGSVKGAASTETADLLEHRAAVMKVTESAWELYDHGEERIKEISRSTWCYELALARAILQDAP